MLRWSLALVAAALLLQVQRCGGQSGANLIYVKARPKAVQAVCGVNVYMATLYLGQAGVFLQVLVNKCPEDIAHLDKENQAKCFAAVTRMMFGFVATMSFLSAAATNCAQSLNIKAACAADVEALIGSLLNLSDCASATTFNCDPAVLSGDQKPGVGHRPTQPPRSAKVRRLRASNFSESEEWGRDPGGLPELPDLVEEFERVADGLPAAPDTWDVSSTAWFQQLTGETRRGLQAALEVLQRLQHLALHRGRATEPQEEPPSRRLGAAGASIGRKPDPPPSFGRKPDPPPTFAHEDGQWVKELVYGDYSRSPEWAAKVKARANRQLDIANCFFVVGKGVGMMAQIGLFINKAVTDCSHETLHERGPEGAPLCVVDVEGFVNSVGMMARFFSLTAAFCPIDGAKKQPKAMCVAEITGVIGASAGVLTAGTNFFNTCDKVGDPPASRRLAQSTAFV